MNYNLGKIRKNNAYTIDEIGELFGINQKTVSRWITKGLPLLHPKKTPQLIMGYDLKDFLQEKCAARRMKLKQNEFCCFKCKKATTARSGSEAFVETGKTGRKEMMLFAKCNECGGKIWRFFKGGKNIYITYSPPP